MLCTCIRLKMMTTETHTAHYVLLFPYTQQAINEKDQVIKQLQEELAEAKAKLNVSLTSVCVCVCMCGGGIPKEYCHYCANFIGG